MYKYFIESIYLGRMSSEIKEAPKFFDLFIDNKLVLWTCYTIKFKKTSCYALRIITNNLQVNVARNAYLTLVTLCYGPQFSV